jgi:hypothetical protein
MFEKMKREEGAEERSICNIIKNVTCTGLNFISQIEINISVNNLLNENCKLPKSDLNNLLT